MTDQLTSKTMIFMLRLEMMEHYPHIEEEEVVTDL